MITTTIWVLIFIAVMLSLAALACVVVYRLILWALGMFDWPDGGPKE